MPLDPDEGRVVAADPLWNGELGVIGEPKVSIDWDHFLAYDESCWSELHGPDAPAPKDTPEAPLVRMQDDAPSHLFVPGVSIAGNQRAFDRDLELVKAAGTEYSLEVPIAFADDPTTDGQIDTRYWNEGDAASFWACLGMSPPASTWIVVTMPPMPTVKSCLQSLGGWSGVCEPVDDALCTNIEWHQSWCGRMHYVKYGDDPDYCADALSAAVDDYLDNSGASAEVVLLPDEMIGPGGVTHHDMERAIGVRVPMQSDAGVVEVDALQSDAAAVSEAADDAADRARWEQNGAEVHSCDEYAFESFYDYSRFERNARQHQRDTRWMFDEAFVADPLVTPVPTRPDIRDKSGNTVWLVNPSYVVDYGFVQWPSATWSAPESQRVDKRLYEHWQSGNRYYHTFKNVYYYLHALRRGPESNWQGGGTYVSKCEAWRNTQRHHYVVNHGWHRRMNQAMAQDGYIDAELETLQRKQDELWATYLRYLHSNDSTERKELLEQIDAAIEDGGRWGCIPDDPSQNTPCDWSPRLYTEGVTRVLDAARKRVREDCVAQLGEGEFDNADLWQRFVDPDALGITITPQWALDGLRSARASALATDFTANTANLRLFLGDIVGASHYRELLRDAVAMLGDDFFVHRSDAAKSIDGDWFSVGVLHQAQTAGSSGGAALCDTDPRMRMRNTIDMQLGGVQMGKFYEHLTEVGQTVPDLAALDEAAKKEHFSTWGDPNPFAGDLEFKDALTIEHSFRHEPGYGTFAAGGIAYNASWTAGFRFRTPLATAAPVVVSFKLGAEGGVSLGGNVGGSNFHGVEPEADPAELVANGGQLVCPAVRTSTFTFAVTPAAFAKGYAQVGAGLLGILEVGVRGSLEVVRLSLPITVSHTWTTANPTRTPTTTTHFDIDLVFTLLSGTISAFVEIDLGVVTIPLYELVIASWTGPQARLRMTRDIEESSACWVAELSSLFDSSTEIDGLPCPCILREREACLDEALEPGN